MGQDKSGGVASHPIHTPPRSAPDYIPTKLFLLHVVVGSSWSHILSHFCMIVCSRNDSNYAGNVVSNATFSKLFGPGLRLGWLEAPPRVRDVVLSRYMYTCSVQCFNLFVAEHVSALQ